MMLGEAGRGRALSPTCRAPSAFLRRKTASKVKMGQGRQEEGFGPFWATTKNWASLNDVIRQQKESTIEGLGVFAFLASIPTE